MQTLLNYLLPIAIGIIMFGIGMGLKAKDFKRVFVAPKAILFGLFGQLVLMPLIGFGIAFAFQLDPIYQLGIVLIAACPGGTSSRSEERRVGKSVDHGGRRIVRAKTRRAG